MRQIVVVGAGLAGVRTVQRLRARGCRDRIVLLGAESYPPYDRPPLSKEVLVGGRDLPVLLDQAGWDALEVVVRLGVSARGLDPQAQRLDTTAGPVGYDELVIATGAQARRLAGLDAPVLRDWADACALRARLRTGRRLVVLGAGLIGCELAAAAVSLGLGAELVDVADGPMVRVVGARLAAEVAALHRAHGVTLHLGRSVAAIEPDRVLLDDATWLDADVVVQAVGAQPCVAWLAGSGLDRAGLASTEGVAASSTGRTALPGVWAVGDVARWQDHRYEHWSAAVDQADRLAAALTGQDPPPPDLAYWWSDQYGLKWQGLGRPGADDEVLVGRWGTRRRLVAVYSRQGRLSGVVGLGAAAFVWRCRSAVATGAALDELDLSGVEPAGAG